ncbi:amino acid permease [Helicobacter sp. faydin-H76]|uniref:Amino acid permease n=2 Tax=Helicobacter cappadocius TaxID=3063998 RepID=A0AA90PR98_9HELI|nr:MULTISPECIES: amino acid permease [unclassified Helicobacter]MDO7253529.1 amino acid permease [Helicobacter sp. faydin-H75]MDP2539456.1 amino acid permease [Helicobacter sp. faydin-H76]
MENSNSKNSLIRDIKFRHLMMIAFGGAIGTGLFVGTGGNIHQAGPLGTLIAYAVGGIIIYSIMLSLGELASYFPNTGSFGDYAYRFIGPATGYVIFWLYWIGWVISAGVEYIAIGFLMQYWFPQIPVYWWVVACASIVFLLNSFSVKIFAEGEFVLSLIKTIAVILFLTIGFIGICYHFYLNGFSGIFENFYFQQGGFFPNGFSAVLGTILVVIFAFSGTEIIGVAVGETKNPREVMPKAIKATLVRLIVFFLGSVFIISVFLPMNDSTITQSPFVSVLERIQLPFLHNGIPYAASIMNFIIITALISTANSGLYGASRMIYGLAEKKMYFSIFSKLNKRGTPIYALYLSMIFSLIALFTTIFAPEVVIEALISVIGFTLIIVWISVSISQYIFRKRYIAQGNSIKDLPYKTPFSPITQIVGILGCSVGAIGAFFDSHQRIGILASIVYIILCYLIYFLTKDKFKHLK